MLGVWQTLPHCGRQVPGGVGVKWGVRGVSLALSACWLPGTVLLERHSVNILLSIQERKLTQAELPSAGHWPWAQYSMRPLSVKGGLFVPLWDGARAQSHQACALAATQKSLLALSRPCGYSVPGQEVNSLADQQPGFIPSCLSMSV